MSASRHFISIFILCSIIVSIATQAAVADATLSSRDKIELLEKERVTASNQPIQLDTELYNKLTTKPRNYSIIVAFTALSPEHGCHPCRYASACLGISLHLWTECNATTKAQEC